MEDNNQSQASQWDTRDCAGTRPANVTRANDHTRKC